MALLTVQQRQQSGSEITFVAADVAGDELPIDTRTALRVLNESGGALTVTVASQLAAEPGLAPDDLVVVIPDTEQHEILFSPSKPWADVDGRAQVTYSTVTSVSVAADRS